MSSLEMSQRPRIRSKVNSVQILAYTPDFSVFNNYVSKIMNESNVKYFFNIAAMLY